MTEKLKTLKDLQGFVVVNEKLVKSDDCKCFYNWNILRQEAIKWIKDNSTIETASPYTKIVLKRIFNLTKEDLK